MWRRWTFQQDSTKHTAKITQEGLAWSSLISWGKFHRKFMDWNCESIRDSRNLGIWKWIVQSNVSRVNHLQKKNIIISNLLPPTVFWFKHTVSSFILWIQYVLFICISTKSEDVMGVDLNWIHCMCWKYIK